MKRIVIVLMLVFCVLSSFGQNHKDRRIRLSNRMDVIHNNFKGMFIETDSTRILVTQLKKKLTIGKMNDDKEIKNVLIRDISKKDSDSIIAVKKLSGKGSATKALLWAAENVAKKEKERAEFEKKHERLLHYVLMMEDGLSTKEEAEKQIINARKEMKKITKGEYFNRYSR